MGAQDERKDKKKRERGQWYSSLGRGKKDEGWWFEGWRAGRG
jgi:hypothetical protein